MPGPKTNEREGTRAVLRHSHVAPNKVREVLALIRNKPVREAEDILRFSERDVAFVIGKLLQSAIANALTNDGMDPDELYVATAYADEGTTQKRWRPRARGRATRIRKRTSHITLIVARLPDDQLARLVARRRAEQLAQRSRRVAGARRSEGDTRTRAQRRAGEPIEAPEETPEEVPAALAAAEAEEQGIVDPQAEARAAVEAGEITETAADTELADAQGATPAGQLAAAEEEAGIVDPQAEALAAIEADEAATETSETTEDGK
jgi:large subunit ribosomal protein L22